VGFIVSEIPLGSVLEKEADPLLGKELAWQER
jgi:hypothetical protein